MSAQGRLRSVVDLKRYKTLARVSANLKCHGRESVRWTPALNGTRFDLIGHWPTGRIPIRIRNFHHSSFGYLTRTSLEYEVPPEDAVGLTAVSSSPAIL